MESINETNSKNIFKTEDTDANTGMFAESNEKPESTAANQNNGSNNFDSMLQMIQMINLMKGTPQASATQEEVNTSPDENNNNNILKPESCEVQAVGALSTPFDESLQNSALKALKAAIPYLEPQQQKSIGLFAKLYEIQQLMSIHNIESQGQFAQSNNKIAILTAMRPFVPKEKQPMIDILIKVIDIKEIYGKMNIGG